MSAETLVDTDFARSICLMEKNLPHHSSNLYQCAALWSTPTHSYVCSGNLDVLLILEWLFFAFDLLARTKTQGQSMQSWALFLSSVRVKSFYVKSFYVRVLATTKDSETGLHRHVISWVVMSPSPCPSREAILLPMCYIIGKWKCQTIILSC